MKRIERLAYYTKHSKRVCDIGCDHAYTLVTAIKQYGVSHGYAVEVASGPLENAKKTIHEHNLDRQITPVLSNGFQEMDASLFDTAILSGMGGILIVEILKNSLEKIKNKKLIIEANNDAAKVRDFLFSQGFIITEEEALYDQGKYYEIMIFEPGAQKYDVYDTEFGPILRKQCSADFLRYYENKANLLLKILPDIKDTHKLDAKYVEYKTVSYIAKGQLMKKYFLLNSENYYRIYFADDKPRPTIFICPGGGYKYTSPRESEPVMEEFIKYGFHVVIVNYRETGNEGYPAPGMYIGKALEEIKKDGRVKEVIGLGFSAGGHALLEYTLHNQDYGYLVRPNLLMLGYPVISSDIAIAHIESFERLLKENFSDESLRRYVSLEKQVTKENAIDLFLWGTYTDESVSVLNSLRLLEVYHTVSASVEYHMFPLGCHGLSIANAETSFGNPNKNIPYISRWIEFAIEWIQLKLAK